MRASTAAPTYFPPHTIHHPLESEPPSSDSLGGAASSDPGSDSTDAPASTQSTSLELRALPSISLTLQDGGLVANNPAVLCLREARLLQGARCGHADTQRVEDIGPHIGAIVSIGTGCFRAEVR